MFGFVTDKNEMDNIELELDHNSPEPTALNIVGRLSSAFRQSSMNILYDIVIYAVDGPPSDTKHK